jgi:hypothetical protein
MNIPVDPSWAWIAPPPYFRRRRQDKVINYNGQVTGQDYLVDGPMMGPDRLKAIIGDFGSSTALPSRNYPGQTFGLTPNDANDKRFGDVVGANWNDVVVGRWGGLEMAEDRRRRQGLRRRTRRTSRCACLLRHRLPSPEESFVAASDAKVRDNV